MGIFQNVRRQPVEDDGLIFSAETVTGTSIRESAKYAGVRIVLQAALGKAVIPLQIDIGFGDVVTPAAQETILPASLNMPNARLLTYPRETVVAEKCEALVDLGLGNSRLKDFYDLWHLANHFDFDGTLLCQAIAATFGRRGTALPLLPPIALTTAFFDDAARRRQWTALLEKSAIPAQLSLGECILLLQEFLLPPLQALRDQSRIGTLWHHEKLSWQEV